jgi:trigger factor
VEAEKIYEITKRESGAENETKIEFKIPPEKLETYVQKEYLRLKNQITIQGFRKGKAPRKVIENHYGKDVFYADAAEDAYKDALEGIFKEFDGEVIGTEESELTEISSEVGALFTATIVTKPTVNIKQYKGLEIERVDLSVSEEEVDKYIEGIRLSRASIMTVERDYVQKGDRISLNFDGYKDGEPFDGGQAEEYDLEIGSGQFIAGFEEQLEGKKIGEEFDVNVTFPEKYHVKELQGAPVVFKCEILSARERILPELDDDFAQDVSAYETFDEYKASARAKLEKQKKDDEDAHYIIEADEALTAQLEVNVPLLMIEQKIDEHVNRWEIENAQKGLTLQNYLNALRIKYQQFRNGFRTIAEKEVNLRLALEKVVDLEKVEVSDEEVDVQYGEYAKNFPGVKLEDIKERFSEKDVRADAAVNKARKLVRESAVIIEKKTDAETETKAE